MAPVRPQPWNHRLTSGSGRGSPRCGQESAGASGRHQLRCFPGRKAGASSVVKPVCWAGQEPGCTHSGCGGVSSLLPPTPTSSREMDPSIPRHSPVSPAPLFLRGSAQLRSLPAPSLTAAAPVPSVPPQLRDQHRMLGRKRSVREVQAKSSFQNLLLSDEGCQGNALFPPELPQ